jgi:hypothetical protein
MGMKKIIKQIEEYIQDKVGEAYATGYSDGTNDAFVDCDLRFSEGVKAERDRVIGMFKFLAQQELESGSGNKAKMYHDVADLVNIANMDFSNYQDDEDF